jgi:hypothetical protein
MQDQALQGVCRHKLTITQLLAPRLSLNVDGWIDLNWPGPLTDQSVQSKNCFD